MDQELFEVGKELFGSSESPVDVKNDNDDLFQAAKQIDDDRQAHAVMNSENKTPDQVLENKNLSKYYGVHSDFVEKNKAYLKRNKEIQDTNKKLNEVREKAPRTADFLLDPDNLVLSKNEIDSLASIEKNQKEYSYATQFAASANLALLNAASLVAHTPSGIYTAYSLPRNMLAEKLGFDQISAVSDSLYNNPVSKFIDEKKNYFEQFAPDSKNDLIEEFSKGNIGQGVKTLGLQVTQNMGTSLGIIASSMMGYGAAALGTVGIGSGAEHAKETQDKGFANPQQTAISGIGSGIFETLLESLELKYFHGLEESLTKAMGRGLLQSEKKQIATAAAKTILGNMGAEGISEAATELGTRSVDWYVGADPNMTLEETIKATLNNFVLGATSGGLMKGPITFATSWSHVQEISRAKQSQTLILDIAQKAKNSELLQNSPDTYKKSIESITKGTSIENITIDKAALDVYFQSKNKNITEGIKELGIEKEYIEADKAGTDIIVPTAQLMASAGKTDLIESIKDNIKFENSSSVNEVNTKIQDEKNTTDELNAQAIENKMPSFTDQLKLIQSEIQTQLEQANNQAINPKLAAKLATEMIRTSAINTFTQPIDVWKKHGFNVTNEPIQVGNQVFYQDGKKTNEQGFYSKLIQTIEDKMSNIQDAKSLNAMLKDIKPEERKWMGLDSFLEGKDKVSKSELLDFLKSNMIQVKEVNLGGEKTLVSQGATVYQVFSESGEGGGTFLDEFNAKQEAGENDTVEKIEWDGETTIEDLEFFQSDSGENRATKFSKYRTPGGENYREVLFTLPPVQVEIAKDKDALSLEGYGRKYSELSEAQKKYIDDDIKYSKEVKTIKFKDTYTSSHWDENNVLAHTRLQDFTDNEGKRILMIEEIQSDWHQDGRKKGYKDSNSDQKIIELKNIRNDLESKMLNFNEYGLKHNVPQGELDSLWKSQSGEFFEQWLDEKKKLHEKHKELTEQISQLQKGVPDAPFKKTWHEFVFKRIARMAAERGYDKIAWTTGEQQAERYDLSKQVDSVGAFKKPDGTFDIEVMRDGRIVMEKSGVAENQLDEMVGKDLAAKIVNEDGKQEKSGFRIYSGLDLKVGGEGMKGFYDKILVDFAKKFGKKFGATVESYTLQESSSFSYYASKDGEGSGAVLYKVQGTGSIPQPIEFYDTIEQAKEAANRLNEQAQTKVHSLEITNEMRKSIMSEGLPLFQGDDTKQGAFNPESMTIHLLKAQDRTTFIHELGHWSLKFRDSLIKEGTATEQMKSDMDVILKELGAESFDKLTNEQHEQWAKMFENYFLKGEAPSSRLKQAMRLIKAWFLDAYQALKGSIELKPEIKEVIDRMIAVENEIDQVKPKPMFNDISALDSILNDKERAEYQEIAEQAESQAKENLQMKLMKDLIKKSKAEYKEKYNEMYEKFFEQEKEKQVFKTLDHIKNEMKIDSNSLEAFSELKKQIPNNLKSKSNGVDVNIIANMMGYKDAISMLNDLIQNKQGLENHVENLTQTEIKKLYPELLQSPELSKEALKAAYNDNLAKLKRKELEILATKDFPTLKKISAKLIARLPRMVEIQEQASAMINDIAVKDLKPYKYRQAEAKFSRDASKAFVKGDIEAAFEAKRLEYLNFELFRQSLKEQEQLNSDMEFFKKLFKSDEKLAKSRDTDIINAGRAILAEFGITKKDKTASQWLSKMKEYDRTRYNQLQILIKASTENAKPIDEITFGKFKQVSDSVKALWELAKNENEFKAGNEILKFEDVEETVSSYLEKLTSKQLEGINKASTSLDKFKVALLGYKNVLTRAEPYFKALGGPLHELVFQKIIDGQTAMQSRNALNIDEFVKAFEPIRETLKEKNKIYSSELNYEFNGLQEILGALLHRGNESNFAKLIVGHKWGELNEQGQLDTSKFIAFENRLIKEKILKKEHYDFIQNVWNILEKQKPDAQKAHKNLYGFYFNEITSKEFKNEFGTYKGGYFPAVADPFKVQKSMQHLEAEDILSTNNSFMYPTTNKGFTKERVETYFAPLTMDLNQVPSHLKKVATLIELGPAIKETTRLFYSDKVSNAFNKIDKTVINEMIIPWLQRTGQQRLPVSGSGVTWRYMDNLARYLRGATGLNAMGFNFINSIQNFAQIPAILTRTQVKSLKQALGHWVLNPKETSRFINENSEFMRNRSGSLLMESYDTLEDLLKNPSHSQDTINFIRKNARFMSEFTQNMVDSVTWMSGYKQAMSEGKPHEIAVKDADSLTRLIQGGFTQAELSRVEAGSPTMRLFTIFYSYFNTVLNNNVGRGVEIVREMGLKKGASHLAGLYLIGFMIPAVLNDVLQNVLAGKSFDEDDDDNFIDDLINLFFSSQTNLALSMIPGGQVFKSGLNAFNNKPYDDKISVSPAIGMLERSLSAPASLAKSVTGEGSSKKAVTDVLTLIGMLSNTPTAPLAKPINYLIDVNTGTAQPSGPIDFTRGVLTGKPGDQK